METCSGRERKSHDEVVFDSRDCPVCAEIGNTEEAQERQEQLETEVEKLGAKLDTLETIIADCEGCSARKIAEKL